MSADQENTTADQALEIDSKETEKDNDGETKLEAKTRKATEENRYDVDSSPHGETVHHVEGCDRY